MLTGLRGFRPDLAPHRIVQQPDAGGRIFHYSFFENGIPAHPKSFGRRATVHADLCEASPQSHKNVMTPPMTILVAECFFQRESDAFEGAESYHGFDSRPRLSSFTRLD